MILPCEKCVLPSGSALLRIEVGSIAKSGERLSCQIEDKCFLRIYSGGISLKKWNDKLPLEFSQLRHTDGNHLDHCLFSSMSSLICFCVIHQQWLYAVVIRNSGLHDPGHVLGCHSGSAATERPFSANLLSPSVCHWITREGRWYMANTFINQANVNPVDNGNPTLGTPSGGTDYGRGDHEGKMGDKLQFNSKKDIFDH